MHRKLTLSLTVMDGVYSVTKLPRGHAIPAWATSGEFFSITHSTDELSVVCRQEAVPGAVVAEHDWRCLRVEGPLDFSAIGILSTLSGALAEAGISLFALSTYSTDYLLVKSATLSRAVTALERIGCRFTSRVT